MKRFILIALLLGLWAAPPARAQFAHLVVVDDLGDAPDAQSDGTCATAAGTCTLRAALQHVNTGTYPSDHVPIIQFSVAGTIQPQIGLPAVMRDGTLIDATTAPGAACGTLVQGTPHTLVIAIDGALTGAAVAGLRIRANGVTVKGFNIRNFMGEGIVAEGLTGTFTCNYLGTDLAGAAAAGNARGMLVMNGPNEITNTLASGNGSSGVHVGGVEGLPFNNTIAGNLIGTNASGDGAVPNLDGILFQQGTSNTIGGVTPEARNVISGNTRHGVHLVKVSDQALAGITILGNYIGTTRNGQAALPNGTNGVHVKALSGYLTSTSIGTLEGIGNLISGNGEAGIFLDQGSRGTEVYGNLIGTDPTGTAPLPNAGDGIIVTGDDTEIGSIHQARGNTIAFNGGAGVKVVEVGATGNMIAGNHLFQNGGLGIDLRGDGVTLNDPMDADIGPNDLQNYPVLTEAVNTGPTTTLSFTLDATPNATFEIYFYTSSTVDPSGFGEGQNYKINASVTTDANGQVSFTTQVPGGEFPVGAFVTATASRAGVGTSEFSGAIQVTGSGGAGVTLNARAFTAGPYQGGAQATALVGGGHLPNGQPYHGAPWFYFGPEQAAGFPANTVDWVLLELRDAPAGPALDRRAALLKADGFITDVDGLSPVAFSNAAPGLYFVVLQHRNHVPVMSAVLVDFSSGAGTYDFTTAQSKAFGTNPMANLGNGHFGLWAGDGNADGAVSAFDFLQVWLPQNGGPPGYHMADFNLSADVTAFDFLQAWLPANGQASQVPE